MATLIVSPEARDDIRTIIVYLRVNAGHLVADKYLAEFERVSDLLTGFPGIGTLKPALGPDARTTVWRPTCSSTIIMGRPTLWSSSVSCTAGDLSQSI